MKYANHFSTKVTPQSEPIPGSSQVPNNAGGFSFEVSNWARLQRFLILGSEGGTYYVKDNALTVENAKAVIECIKEDGARSVSEIVAVSKEGRAPKNDPAIFALALACTYGDPKTKALAYGAITDVCRIGTHLFQFAECIQKLRGWSRGLRNGVARFYLGRPTDDVAYQVVKYRQRNGWSHRDVLRLCHPHAPVPKLNGLFKWAVGKDATELPAIVEAFNEVQKTKSLKTVVDLTLKHDLPWEALPTEFLKKPEVWQALLPSMKPTALIRNLGRLGSVGLLTSNLDGTAKDIADTLTNAEALRRARIHPIQVLNALRVYSKGCGEKGRLAWTPVPRVVDALDEAFYLTFKNVEPTGKQTLLALDVSGSMHGNPIAGTALDAATASVAMAMVTARTEPEHELVAFSHRLIRLSISPKARLQDVIRDTQKIDFGGTDCAIPMLYALERKLKIDTFVIYTDSETWAGNIHPVQALNKYRQTTGIPAKLIVVGMCSNGFTIADPNDRGMLDVVGFDTATPNVISQFSME